MKDFRILCVDNESEITGLLKALLEAEGYGVSTARDGEEALDLLHRETAHAAIIDLSMPKMDGLNLLKRIKQQYPAIDVMIITGHGTVKNAVEAIKAGAYDFLEKPMNVDYVRQRIQNLYQQYCLKEENRALRSQLRDKFHPRNLIGTAPIMQKIYEMIDHVRNDATTVLIQGESGTGKEQVARAIHYSGDRSTELFVPVDCGAINPNLFESELFGHVKGAFTGATATKAGLLQIAGKGTLFFDEIAEIPLQLQSKLLRSIQEREYRPVGSSEIHRFQARIIAATNKNLQREVKEGRFREDLFYRLHVVVIQMPPLRERIEDIPYLALHFVRKFSSERHPVETISPDAMKLIMQYRWNGNVRELENCIEQAVSLGNGTTISPDDLPTHIRGGFSSLLTPVPSSVTNLVDAERTAIGNAMRESRGNKRKAARMLDISVTTLYKKIKEYDLEGKDPVA